MNTPPQDAEERSFVETALRAVDAGDAGHWPTVAGYLADEVRRLRATATPNDHRAEAEALLEGSRRYSPAHPMRADMLSRATVHAVLSLGPEHAEPERPAPTSITVEQQADYVQPKPAPRKRTAKKTTAPKETSK